MGLSSPSVLPLCSLQAPLNCHEVSGPFTAPLFHHVEHLIPLAYRSALWGASQLQQGGHSKIQPDSKASLGLLRLANYKLISVFCVLPYTQRTPETEVVVGWRGLGVGEGHGLRQQEGDGWERAGKEDTVPSTRDSSEQFKTSFLPASQHFHLLYNDNLEPTFCRSITMPGERIGAVCLPPLPPPSPKV